MKWVALLLVTATPALAEDYDPAILEACLGSRPPDKAEVCIGLGARACLETEAGRTTPGVGYCYGAEWEDWDARLNAVYAALIPQLRELDADNAGGPLDLPSSEEALRRAQRAWIAFRDAACDWEYTRWSGGTGGGPASAECMMRLTAQQTLFLQDRLW